MIEEEATVAALENDQAWVDSAHGSACARCAARAGCGQSLLSRVLGEGRQQDGMRLRLPRPDPALQVGDRVLIGIPEAALLQGAFMLYLVPVLALMVGSVAAQTLSGLDWVAFAGGSAAFLLSLLWVRHRLRRWGRDSSRQPRILRRLPASAEPAATPPQAVKVL